MSKLCPHTGRNVVYLVCQECESKICRQRDEPQKSAYIKHENTHKNKIQNIDKVKDDKF